MSVPQYGPLVSAGTSPAPREPPRRCSQGLLGAPGRRAPLRAPRADGRAPASQARRGRPLDSGRKVGLASQAPRESYPPKSVRPLERHHRGRPRSSSPASFSLWEMLSRMNPHATQPTSLQALARSLRQNRQLIFCK